MTHLSQILKHSKWTLLAAGINLILQLGLYFLIAQYIEPQELGSYFLAAALIFIPTAIIEYSFTSSLIKQAEIGSSDYKAVLIINVLTAVIFIIAGSVMALGLAYWYDNAAISYYYFLLLPFLLLWTLASIQNAGLRRELKMYKLSIIDLSSSVINFALAAFLLWKGFAVLALIAGQVAKVLWQFISLSLTTNYLHWTTPTTKSTINKHLDFGKYIVGEKSFGVALGYMDIFVINHFLGTQAVGIYDLLKRFIMRPLVAAYLALEQVLFPLLSQSVDQVQRYQAYFKAFGKLTAIFLLSYVFIFFAEELLQLLPESYQANWKLFALLILYAISVILANPIDIIAYSLGKTKRFFSWTVWTGLLQLVLMIISLWQGSLELMLVVMTAVQLLLYLLAYGFMVGSDKHISMRAWAQPVHFFLVMTGIMIGLIYVAIPKMVAAVIYVLLFGLLHRLMFGQKINLFT